MANLPTAPGNHQVVPKSDVVWNCKVRQHPDLFRKVGSSCGLGPTGRRGAPCSFAIPPAIDVDNINSLIECGGTIGRAETPRAASKVTVTPKPCFHFFLCSTRESMMSDGSLHEPQLAAVSWPSALGVDCAELPDCHHSDQEPSPVSCPPACSLAPWPFPCCQRPPSCRLAHPG